MPGWTASIKSIIQTGKFFVLLSSDPLEQNKRSWEKQTIPTLTLFFNFNVWVQGDNLEFYNLKLIFNFIYKFS